MASRIINMAKSIPLTKKPKQFARVAVCTLNQWAMDFEQNKKNIIESIQIARQNKCTIRTGPELEIPGYGCEDHFLEMDTEHHSWEVLGDIIQKGLTQDILVDLGMPVYHKGGLYNCRVVCLNGKILLVRPKHHLAEGGNYREPRWFSAWANKNNTLENYKLPYHIQEIIGQETVPFGNAIIQANDTQIGFEICQELWMNRPMNGYLNLDGCEIIINPSGSHYELKKQHLRIQMIQQATQKSGGAYLYSNCRGCDGGRVYYDGNSIIAQNGKILQMSDMFSLKEVDVLINDIDFHAIRQKRASSKEIAEQTTTNRIFQRVLADITIGNIDFNESIQEFTEENQLILTPSNEISYGPSCYMWDYLKRSGGMGYFLALSGGADSAASALVIYNMCKIVFKSIKEEQDDKVLDSLRKIVREPEYVPQSPKEICSKILYTGYMGSDNSSTETRKRAENLANEIGATHYSLNISDVFKSFQNEATRIFNEQPKFQSQGGSISEDLALQNIQARSRMILAYLMGGLIPWQIRKNGFLLCVGSANLDEGLRGYFTKYDCSSADINPIGSISKTDIKKFLKWNYEQGIQTAKEICDATPTAELRPLGEGEEIVQSDEADMGMSYDELKYYGYLRKVEKMGPVSMFKKLIVLWKDKSPEEIAKKVKYFFKTYSQNRHKQTTLTPAYHVENYGIDDNRYDLRQFLYNSNWTYQFEKIDEIVKELNEKNNKNN